MDSRQKNVTIFSAFYSRFHRPDHDFLEQCSDFSRPWHRLIVHKNDEFVGKVKPSWGLTSDALILIVLDAAAVR